jgi:hypothetical protein
MFHLIKLIIFLAGIVLIAYFALPYFGYEFNLNYFNESKATCQQRLDECAKDLVKQGTQNATCNLNCVNPALIIKKQ